MHEILALWAVPRSTSTAFEWMMRTRGDMTCFHEPFGEPWYQGEAPLWPRLKPDSKRTPGLTFESVWQELKAAANAGPVFTKDFPHYIAHMWTDAFLAHFRHSFLIRDPAKVTTSMFKHWPDFVPEETGFVPQRQLFDRLSDRTGTAPPVIDSDDLLENPHGIVEAYCAAVGIAFLPEALSWEPGARDEVSWFDGGSWHGNLRGSDGLKPQPRSYIDISEAPDRVKEIHEMVLPHYRHLHAHRLRAPETAIAG
jgi:hypothetical protein